MIVMKFKNYSSHLLLLYYYCDCFSFPSDLQYAICKVKRSLEQRVLDTFSILEGPMKNHFKSGFMCCWKLLIVGINCPEASSFLKSWLGLSNAKDSIEGVTVN